MALTALGAFYLFGILSAILVIMYPQILTDRLRNAVSSGIMLGMGWLAVLVLAKAVGLAYIVVAVPVLICSALFVFGYLTPKALRSPVEKMIAQYLDYLSLTVSETTLPWVRRFRFFFGWLGLAVD